MVNILPAFRFGVALAVTSLLAAVPIASTAAWPMYQGNAAHTGYVPVTLDPSRFSVRWHRSFGRPDINPVVAAEGKVFVSDYQLDPNSTPRLYALDERTGTTLWSHAFPRVHSVNPPAFAYGNVYLQTGNHARDTYLRAYNATTGQLVFQAPHPAQWDRYLAPTIDGGTVYVNGGVFGGMYAFDAFSGRAQWFQQLNQYDEWTPAVDRAHVYAYVGTQFYRDNTAGLYAFDRSSGAFRFRIVDPEFDWVASPYSLHFAPVVGDVADVLVVQGRRLMSFDLVNRRLRWQLHGGFAGQPTVARGVVYAIDAGALCAFDEVSGSLLWRWQPLVQALTGTVIVTDSHALVRSANATYAIDLRTHRDVWFFPVGGDLTLSGGTLYITTGVNRLGPARGGALVAINTDGGGGPVLDVKVNGADGPLVLRRGEGSTVTLSLNPAGQAGQPADWWISAQASAFGTFWFVPSQGWVRSQTPFRAYSGPLTALAGLPVLQTALPPGQYLFSFAVDNPDGIMTATYIDNAILTVQ